MGLRHRQYLTEATFNLDRDVDMLYTRSGLDKLHGALASEKVDRIRRAFAPLRRGQTLFSLFSDDLRTRVAKRADKVNPVSIEVAISSEGSFYRPLAHRVVISPNVGAIGLIQQALTTNDPIAYIKATVGTQYKRLVREFDAPNMKGTIAHELSHWASDSIHNRNIERSIDVAREKGIQSLRGKFPSVEQTPMEFDAQMHAIRAIKRVIGKRAFDKMTWGDLFRHKGSLVSNFKIGGTSSHLGQDVYDQTMKRFVKRLHREGLLGKSMRNFPNYWEYRNIVAGI